MQRMRYPIQIIVGGLYGSEAKGAIAAYLVRRDQIDFAVRTGATNAGHTVGYACADGTHVRAAMQQLPVGWVRPETKLVLGAGTLIDLAILKRECGLVSQLTGCDVRDRLYIDYRAYIHRPVHHDRATNADRHHMIGATGKGCSEALIDRVRLRGLENWTVGAEARVNSDLNGYDICDTERLLNYAWDDGARIQLEGTQGQLLDLYLGPYPYTTHKQTGPAQWMLEAGLSPALPTEIWSVVRTFPIRVAGNSGPLPCEISWPLLAREINQKRALAGCAPIADEAAIVAFERAVRDVTRTLPAHVIPAGSDGLDQQNWADRERYATALSEINKAALSLLDGATRCELAKLFEMTTVTKKLRRVARQDWPTLRTSSRQIRPHKVAVTFLNYAFPEHWFGSDLLTVGEHGYLRQYQTACEAPVALTTRGPDDCHVIEVVR